MTVPENTPSQAHSLKGDSFVSGSLDDSEISLLDIVNFLRSAWKKLAIAAIVGAVLGIGSWYILGSYKAELVLNNNGGTDLVGWRALQKVMPNLASQIIDESKVPEGQESLYRTLSSPEWWQKNALASYAMTKADTKDLSSTVGLESAGVLIVSINLTAAGSSRALAIENVRGAKNFLLQGASYLAIKSMLSAQESQLINSDAEISHKINSTQVELGYQEMRLKSLESLAKRFPNEQKSAGQVVDPKDSGAKYLPMSTQIIAANADINASKESLERLKDDQGQMKTLRAWVEQVTPLMSSTYDGIALTHQLLEQEAEIRKTIDPNDYKALALVDIIRSNFLANNVRFSRSFEMNTAPTVDGKKGMLKSTVVGLAGALPLERS
jgi:hypothetical protein